MKMLHLFYSATLKSISLEYQDCSIINIVVKEKNSIQDKVKKVTSSLTNLGVRVFYKHLSWGDD